MELYGTVFLPRFGLWAVTRHPNATYGAPRKSGSMRGTADETYDVIIVGGGFAGLQALRNLTDASWKVSSERRLRILLIEARDRVGGRINTDMIAVRGELFPIDIGGQWVGPPQERMVKLCQEFGLNLLKQHYIKNGDDRMTDIAGVRLANPLSDAARAEVDAFCEWIDRCCSSIDSSAPWKLEDADKLDRMSLQNLLEERVQSAEARQEITELTLASLCVHPSDLSALGFVAEM